MARVSDIAGSTDPAYRHVTISPSDSSDVDSRIRALRVMSDGNVAIMDEAGTTVTYAQFAGDIMPIRPKRVLSTGTTATVVGWI